MEKEKDKALRSARKWIKEMPHDDFCSWLDNHSQHCDCGKVVEVEQIDATLRKKPVRRGIRERRR